MGIQPGKYDIELIRRTSELLEKYKDKYNLTLLMNCLLSLIVLPHEHNKTRQLNFLNSDFRTIPELGFIMVSPNFQFDTQNQGNSLKNLLRRIRNGISHQRINTITEKKKWTGVIIQDINKNGTVGLNLELKTSQLRKLAIFIGAQYLNEIK